MTLPLKLVGSMKSLEGFDRKAFEAVHESGEKITSVRFNPAKISDELNTMLPIREAVPWSSFGYYLDKRPSFTFDPLFHAGVYYVQEASSMFLEQALKQTCDLSKSIKILDLCAAPGGKSTLIQSLISEDSLLVSNELIKSRVGTLKENLAKWGGANIILSNNDPRDLGRLGNYFDIIVVDAPCSGSGLFRREPEAIDEWSEAAVHLCSQRQQRILADVWPSLKKNGILIYSTCSYSQEENEDIVSWMCREFAVDSLPLSITDSPGIVQTITGEKPAYGYRFYPDKVKGEGFFISCVKKKEGGEFFFPRAGNQSLTKLGKKETALVTNYIKRDLFLIFFIHDGLVNALPASLERDLIYLRAFLYLKKAGVLLGKLIGKELVPDHQFALSTLINPEWPSIPVNLEEAIKYLQKEELNLDSFFRGWVLLRYKNQNLGWIKILKDRINNYYPKEWRILKKENN
jgi:16S rRNA C967 or C1407 C5-methylase (RsmB/RsmF family)/NOL1/NOP2/fmu family ribosome biogenesis protein